MATDINEQVKNAFNAAKQALNDDLKQNFYNAAQARNYAFRQLNNNANARHSLYSGTPAAAQMQYDQQTYLPGAAAMAERAIQKQLENQDKWDQYMEYIKKLNDQTNYYNNLTKNLNGGSYSNFSGE